MRLFVLLMFFVSCFDTWAAYNPNNPNGQKTMANSAPVVVASDQSSIPVAATLSAETTKVIGTVNISSGQTVQTKAAVNLSASFSCITNLTTSAQTFTAPSNAVGFMIQYPSISTNTDNVRFALGGTATTSTGLRLEPGRSEWLPGGSNVSVIAETASSQTVCIQWISQ